MSGDLADFIKLPESNVAETNSSVIEWRNVVPSHQNLFENLVLNNTTIYVLGEFDQNNPPAKIKESKLNPYSAFMTLMSVSIAFVDCANQPELLKQNPLLQSFEQGNGAAGQLRNLFSFALSIQDRLDEPEIGQSIIEATRKVAKGLITQAAESKNIFPKEIERAGGMSRGHIKHLRSSLAGVDVSCSSCDSKKDFGCGGASGDLPNPNPTINDVQEAAKRLETKLGARIAA